MARILLVDDDAAIRGLLQEWLVARGNEVVLAVDGAEALVLAAARPPDILVSDVFMPRGSGIDLCHSLRASPDLKDVYVLLITGEDAAWLEIAALAAGADDFVRKPLRHEEFVTRVEIGLRVRALQAEIRRLRGEAAPALLPS